MPERSHSDAVTGTSFLSRFQEHIEDDREDGDASDDDREYEKEHIQFGDFLVLYPSGETNNDVEVLPHYLDKYRKQRCVLLQ